MLALITGITGQDGSYLAELLLEKGYTVYGMIRRTSTPNTSRIDHLLPKLRIVYGDLADTSNIHLVLQEITAHPFDRLEVYNLAAMSHVKISFEMPEYAADIDGIGTLRILEAIRKSPYANKIRFYQASTSELYGKVVEIPQKETTPFNPVSPYAAAKLYAYYITNIYRDASGMYACTGILFNHESPRRGELFVTAKIVKGIRDILAGRLDVLELGNLDSKRDWGHAKDYVEGMWRMLQQESPRDYVLATGKTYTVREFVERCFAHVGVPFAWKEDGLTAEGLTTGVRTDTNQVVVRVNPIYFRPNEVDLLLGDATRAQEELGWTPEHTLDTLIADMFSSREQ
jgi:GDPmannose 4,6-dehydratase